jgi:hypothetical protein
VQHGDEPDPARVLAHACIVMAAARLFLTKIKSGARAGSIVGA